MKSIFLTLLFCSFYCAIAATNPYIDTDMNLIRKDYIAAVESEEKTNDLLKRLSSESIKEPLLIAYKGATEALKAKHAFNPYTKMSYLRKSQKTMEQAIAMRPTDIEMRFLRFSVQHYLPSFLGASKNLVEDKTIIINRITDTTLDKSLQQSIGKFMIESGRCTAGEVQKVRTALQ